MPDESIDNNGEKMENKGREVRQGPTEMLISGIVGGSTARATVDAIRLLNIEPFFNEDNLRSIFKKLEECDDYAESADFNGEMMFIALSLPIVNGIIHIASNRNDLRRATQWVVQEWKDGANKDPDRVSILSALTLIYLAVKGWQRFRESSKREIWKRIITRVQKLSSERLHDDDDAQFEIK